MASLGAGGPGNGPSLPPPPHRQGTRSQLGMQPPEVCARGLSWSRLLLHTKFSFNFWPEPGKAKLPWDLSPWASALDPESSGNELAGVTGRMASERRGQAAPARAPETRKLRDAPNWPQVALGHRTRSRSEPTSQSLTPSSRTPARTRGWSRRVGHSPRPHPCSGKTPRLCTSNTV